MKLFESIYKTDFTYKVRLYDDVSRETSEESVSNKYEYYTPCSDGSYTCLTDNVRLEKHLGQYKDTHSQYGVFSPTDRYIRDHHWRKSYNHNPRIWYLDIETRVTRNEFPSPEKALEEISLMQIYDNFTETMYVLGLRDFVVQKGYELNFKHRYVVCNNEKHMLEVFCVLFKKLNPLIVYAWNGLGFDYPYIYNRLKANNIDPNSLSNYGNVKLSVDNTDGFITFDLSSDGHYFLDLLKVYKKFTFENLPSYSLDSVSQHELNDCKIKHTEFDDFDSFYTGKNYTVSSEPYDDKVREEIRQLKILERDNVITEEQKKRLQELIAFQFVYYGVQDVYLLKRLDDAKNFTSIIITIAEMLGCQLNDTLGTIKPWGNGLKNLYHEQKLIIPPMQNNVLANVVGGYVRNPLFGIHVWMLSEDANSMYPMLAMKGFNMSPETYVPHEKLPTDLREHIEKYYNDQCESKILDYSDEILTRTKELLHKYNYAMGINGAVFDRSKLGIVPKMVSDIYYGRKEDKKTMLKYEQQVELINDILKSREVK